MWKILLFQEKLEVSELKKWPVFIVRHGLILFAVFSHFHFMTTGEGVLRNLITADGVATLYTVVLRYHRDIDIAELENQER